MRDRVAGPSGLTLSHLTARSGAETSQKKAQVAAHASSGDKYYRSFLRGDNASRDGDVVFQRDEHARFDQGTARSSTDNAARSK